MKNVVEFPREFFAYFNALETYSELLFTHQPPLAVPASRSFSSASVNVKDFFLQLVTPEHFEFLGGF